MLSHLPSLTLGLFVTNGTPSVRAGNYGERE